MTIKLAAWQLVVVGLVIGVLAATGVALAVSGGGSSKPAAQPVVSVTADVEKHADVAPTTAPPTSTSVPPTEPPPPPAPTEPPVRTNCAEIKATGYQSDAERNYYLANCTGAPSAATARPGSGSAPGPSPAVAPGGPASATLTAEEQHYKDQATAQIGYLNAQVSQFTNGNYQAYGAGAILQFCAILGNVVTAMDNLQPVPPRYRAVHDAMRSAHVTFHNDCLAIQNVKTAAQANTWLARFDVDIDLANNAIGDYNRVVGIQLQNLRK